MIKSKKVNQIDDSYFDTIVVATYEKPYCFQQTNGCQDRGVVCFNVPEINHDSEYATIGEAIEGEECGVAFEDWLAADPNDSAFDDIVFERNVYPQLQDLANDMHAKGLIEPGEYQIRIDW